jgi:hypothetical protein
VIAGTARGALARLVTQASTSNRSVGVDAGYSSLSFVTQAGEGARGPSKELCLPSLRVEWAARTTI